VENSLTDSASPASEGSNALLVIRGAIGGTLMGLANLVPGISGGTMLLAAGVYPGFIAAIAEATTLRFRFRSLLLLGTIVVSAALSILLLAGTVKDLVVDHRWIMYSLFIGLTLGGIPLVWRMARPMNRSLLVSALVCFGLMVVMALSGAGVSGDTGRNYPLIFLAGLAASSAMILPGVSGGYLLLLLGQYESILGTVDQLKSGLLGNGSGAAPDLALVLDAMHVVIPLGIGIVVGVVGVSNLLQWLLQRYEKATLGALLGLLFGAVVGLWPYQQAHLPQTGDVIKGQVVTLENAESFDADHWPVRFFEPSAGQAASSLALVGLGLAGTLLIGRLGNSNGGDD
jgi:putative membrane protein